MSEANKELVRRAATTLIEEGDLDAADQYFHPAYLNHEAADGRPGGPDGAREVAAWLRETFGDPRLEEQDALAEGDRVVVRVIFRGTHQGDLMGIPATGKSFAVQQIHEYRIEDGKIAEHWACRDDVGLMRQIGALPDRQMAS